MKLIATLLLACLFNSAFAEFNQTSLELAAAKKLEITNLESYDWKIELGPLANMVNIEFSYEVEFFDETLDIVTFFCTGTAANSDSPTFISLNCIEEEPRLWDEF